MRLRRTAVALLLAATATLTTPPASASSGDAHDRTGGSRFPTGTATAPDGRTALTDARGRRLQLRGFNLDKYAEATGADLTGIAAQGFTLVRLPVSWARLEPSRGRLDPAELARLHHLLDAADRAGLLVLIDFHQDVYGPKFVGGTNGVPAWATRDEGLPFTPNPDDWFAGYFQPAVQTAFRHLYDDPDLRAWQADFYTRLARELRGHRSLLGYDLFNEPFGPVPGDPSDPAVLAAASAALEQGRLAGMYRRLIAAVRQVDTRAWLFVEPTVLVGQGVPTALPGFADPRPGAPRLGYAPHFYDTAVENGADWDQSDGFVERYAAAVTAYPAAHRLPVLVGEWGPPNSRTPGNRRLVARQVAAMDGPQGFAEGWTMWYWCRGTGGYCALDPAGRPAPGDEPAFGPYPVAVAGTGVSTAVSTTGGTVRWSADGTGHTSELLLPPTAFPHGARVDVTPAGARVEVEQPGAGRAGTVRIRLPHARPGTPVTVTVTGFTGFTA
ncbi:cellulase family glycosylhydrolase [Kitasatospora sp. NPDC101183]|uniref:cellulase family glycosylhydrolase n=1 Tax=Kitasatospora sp. NPDC101183 TaxID=3364100 RepID=UPI0037F7F04A